MQLPLITYTSSLYPGIDFSQTLVIACQHILETTINLFDELSERGLDPKNIHVIGKCYSTNMDIVHEMERRGIQVSPLSHAYDSHRSFDDQFEEYIEEFFSNLVSSVDLHAFTTIILLDDGGHLLTYANDFLQDVHTVVGIEQTSSGYEKVKDLALRFPVINVARSRTKLGAEAGFVAKQVSGFIERYITAERLVDPKILIIGQGEIGKRIKDILDTEFTVRGADAISELSDFATDFKSDLNAFDVVIGATGKEVLLPGEFSLLKKNAHLISVSSSDREFSAAYIRQRVPVDHNCHTNVDVDGVTLINSGFPINFTGARHSLPPEVIQLTRSLLLIALFQSLEKNLSHSLIELSDTQDDVEVEFQRIIKDMDIVV